VTLGDIVRWLRGLVEVSIEIVDGSCHGKQRYGHWFSAERAASDMNQKPNTRRTLEPYACKVCGGYHIGGAR